MRGGWVILHEVWRGVEGWPRAGEEVLQSLMQAIIVPVLCRGREKECGMEIGSRDHGYVPAFLVAGRAHGVCVLNITHVAHWTYENGGSDGGLNGVKGWGKLRLVNRMVNGGVVGRK